MGGDTIERRTRVGQQLVLPLELVQSVRFSLGQRTTVSAQQNLSCFGEHQGNIHAA